MPTRARITLVDGTVLDDTEALAVRPAALHFRRPRSFLPGEKEVAIPLDQVRQIEYEVTLDPEHPGAPAWRGPEPGDLEALPITTRR